MGPKAVIEIMQERQIDYEKRQPRGENKHIAAIGVIAQGLADNIKSVCHNTIA